MKKKFITISLIAVFSILLWIFVSLSNDYFTTLSLPVKFMNVPEGYLITELSSDEIALSLKGNGWLLAQITFGSEPYFLVDVKNKAGSQSVLVRNNVSLNSWISSNLQITEITPNILSFEVEKVFKKKVPVSKMFGVTAGNGYGIVSQVIIEPDSVLLIGSEKALNKINFAETEELEFEELTEPLQTEVGFKHIKDVSFSPPKITVRVDVEKIVDKSIDGVAVLTANVPKNQTLEIIPTQINVVLRGGLNQLASIDGEDIKAYVDFKQALLDTLGAIEPVVQPPQFTEVLTVSPQRLKYIIKKY